MFTGAYAVNPANGALIPVWIADYVLMEYGTGAIMAVPGHDERDFEFATKFDAADRARGGRRGRGRTHALRRRGPYLGDGVAGELGAVRRARRRRGEGADHRLARRRRTRGAGGDELPPARLVHLAAALLGSADPDHLLRRVRHGAGARAGPARSCCPNIADFKPDDSGVSPLARHEEWYRVPCPTCGKKARRETDVSDTFLDSAWYFLRYPSVPRADVAFDRALTKRWLPVTTYIGGNEHAVLHLLYSRFITMVLHDQGLLDFEEPFTRFRAHGLIIREGAKMSKSKGNVVNPDDYIDEWGADAFRTYLMFLGPFEEGGDFRDAGISGVKRFLDRLWASVRDCTTDGAPDAEVMRKLHATIKKVGEDIPALSYNTAIAAMMEYMNTLRRGERHAASRRGGAAVVQLVAPFAPHVAEELWEMLGHTHERLRRALAGVRPVAARLRHLRARGAGGRQDARQGGGGARTSTRQAALAAVRDDAALTRFLTGEPRKVIFVPGRLLNVVL